MGISREILQEYAVAWGDKPKPQVAEEVASMAMETRQIPDPYILRYDCRGKLTSQTGELVELSIDTASPLGRLEYQGFREVETLGRDNEYGTVIWISPPHAERSGQTKAVISEIRTNANGKYLFNRAILLDINLAEALRLANSLAQDYVYLTEAHLRSRPIFIAEAFDWHHIPDPRQVKMIEQDEDTREKQEALRWGRAIADNLPKIYEIAMKAKLYGGTSPSCPPGLQKPTAFEKFFGAKKLCCTCPKCGRQVEAEIYAGKIHCPQCSAEAEWKKPGEL